MPEIFENYSELMLEWANETKKPSQKPLRFIAPAVGGPRFCSHYIMASYYVSITEQATAKCYLFVN